MRYGSQVTGYHADIIHNRPKGSNYHIADHMGRVYLCNCCKRVLLNGRHLHYFPSKGRSAWRNKRNINDFNKHIYLTDS